MVSPSGYVLNVLGDRKVDLRTAAETEQPLAESVPEFDYSRNRPLVCFVSFESGLITHLAMGIRGQRAATKRSRLNLRDLRELPEPVPYDEVLARIPQRVRRFVREAFGRGGLLPPKSFQHVIEAIRSLSPEARAILSRFSEQRRAAIRALTKEEKQSLAYQKEAVATALQLAGIDRKVLYDWNPPETEKPISFLDGLDCARVREDAVIAGDLAKIPGFELVRMLAPAVAVFKGENTRLAVVMANKLPLEKQLGADLIYVNETFQSFVAIQYKMMEQEGGRSCFRLPNVQLTEELERMGRVRDELKRCDSDLALDGYRLSDNPFFIKLCPRLMFDPDNAGLSHGMYLPLDYWDRLSNDESIVGKQGGKSVDFLNARRYFDNSAFVHLISGAWIGTTTQQSAVLRSLVREVVGSGRTLTLAVKRDVKHEHADDVSWRSADVNDEPVVRLSDLLHDGDN